MDALAELLRVIKLDSAIYFNAEMSEPWCLVTPESKVLAPWLAQGDRHLIVYHLLLQGSAYVRVSEQEAIALVPGDVVCCPHGNQHLLGSGAQALRVEADLAVPDMLARGLEVLQLGGGGARARFICGFLACERELSEVFLQGLPALVKVSIQGDETGLWLENSLKFAVGQASNRDPGTIAMLAKLSEVLFAETLRRFARELPAGETGWIASLRDANVGKALALLLKEPAYPWTLGELAQKAGVSRTVLAERFRHFLGESPMAFLTNWRLRLGARALTSTNQSVTEIALGVGYESESAFNRAFKRQYTLPPARYRREQGRLGSMAPAGSTAG
jgi:AraC-like DNA-binding protein